jgi:hypothetical protein
MWGFKAAFRIIAAVVVVGGAVIAAGAWLLGRGCNG